jgi:hypothetical protein
MLKEKLSSRKFLITLWAICTLSYALITKVDVSWFSGLAPILGLIITAYIGGQTYLDSKNKEK